MEAGGEDRGEHRRTESGVTDCVGLALGFIRQRGQLLRRALHGIAMPCQRPGKFCAFIEKALERGRQVMVPCRTSPCHGVGFGD